MSHELIQLNTPYGRDARFQGEVLGKRTLLHFQPKEDLRDLATGLRESLANPLELPELKLACVPGDRVVIALAEETPRADAVVAMLWKQLSAGGIQPEDLLILKPGTWGGTSSVDPRSLLSKDLQEKIQLKRHDPTEKEVCGYLASTASGERIYLAKELLEADLVIPVGPASFDPVLGYCGEASVLYPAFSETNAIMKSIGHGHDELSPSEARPLRQQVEEVGWLLGVQFVISIIPGRGKEVQSIFVGSADAVARDVRAELNSTCRIELEERAEMVLVAVEETTTPQTWEQVAHAIDVARRIVSRDGRIVVLSQLTQKRGPGLDILKEARTPSEALKPIQNVSPPDFLAATRIAKAVDWANVYLLSDLPAEEIEDLFIIPLASELEVQKLLQGDETTVIIESAQKVYASCE
ncbi:lactate racemase domain-containing protein [Thalassoglobus polymorphus]|uniref:LarA-like N-terminal domain-containing protein n=1 Tax=Thalassoglobus polymorphus TaxID=2527994 RepID=A0A517QKH9_9PLAN|nr:lactate racemase domain-containing protein [Thalassoglobus polymorphus]QDT32135.1 hypothetical protein Mal48_13770 [Thalassoglobus polymorphus]